jgi:phosphoglucomutase
MVKYLLNNLFRNQDILPAVQFVNTSMHGVSSPFVRRGMRVFGFPDQAVIEVAEQRDPDPEFSTVAFPNPEEKGEPTISIPCLTRFMFDFLQEHL